MFDRYENYLLVVLDRSATMANEQSGVKFFIILSILLGAAVGPCMSDDDDDSSPIIDVIQSFMKESSKGQAGGNYKTFNLFYLLSLSRYRSFGADAAGILAIRWR